MIDFNDNQFWTADNLTLFWDDLKGMLQYAAPGLMILAAVMIIPRVIYAIKSALIQEDDKEEIYYEEDN